MEAWTSLDLGQTTYMFPRRQTARVNRVLMEALPLLERVARMLMVFLAIPFQHIVRIRDPHAAAERFHHGRGAVEHLVRVHDAEFYTDLGRGAGNRLGLAGAVWLGPISLPMALGYDVVGVGFAGCNVRAHETLSTEVFQEPAHLVVPSLERLIVGETCDVVEGRDCAAVVRRHAVVRVANEEGKVEGLQDLLGDHGRVSWFGRRVVRVWCFAATLLHAVTVCLRLIGGVAVGYGTVANGPGGGSVVRFSAYAALDPPNGIPQRRGNACWSTAWRKKIVQDVLDENPLVLFLLTLDLVHAKVGRDLVLPSFVLDPFEDGTVGGIAESTLNAALLVGFIPI